MCDCNRAGQEPEQTLPMSASVTQPFNEYAPWGATNA